MEVRSIDHVNLRIPPNEIEAAVDFYGDRLGLPIEGLERHRRGEQSFFDVRLAPDHVIHLWPADTFDPPSGHNFNHVALVVETHINNLKDHLEAANIPIERELESPLGATDRSPAVYVMDPFGYQIELKASSK